MAKSRTTSTCKKNKSTCEAQNCSGKATKKSIFGKIKIVKLFRWRLNDCAEDVKEGHFAVIVVEGDEPKRFVVALSYLTHSTFLKLLEQAAEEYGFVHEGALSIPCQSSELEKILDDRQWQEEERGSSSDVNWGYYKSMVRNLFF